MTSFSSVNMSIGAGHILLHELKAGKMLMAELRPPTQDFAVDYTQGGLSTFIGQSVTRPPTQDFPVDYTQGGPSTSNHQMVQLQERQHGQTM